MGRNSSSAVACRNLALRFGISEVREDLPIRPKKRNPLRFAGTDIVCSATSSYHQDDEFKYLVPILSEYDYPAIDPELRVCEDCLGDEGLKAYVRGHADAKECSFCGAISKEEIAAPLDQLVDHMCVCLAVHYDDPDNAGMVYESAEGGYQGQVWDTHEFVQWHLGIDLPNDDDGKLLDAICDGLGDHLWCEAYIYSLSPGEALAYSWRTFCNLVKHRSRYFFAQTPRDPDDDRDLLSPSDLLEVIVDYARSNGLVRVVPGGQEYHRARFQPPGIRLATPSELGPPPEERAAQNRMSPAGIVMTYVSEDELTALHETAVAPGTYAIGKFRTLRDIRILDLADLPPVPGLFDEVPDTLEYDPRKTLIFLHDVAGDIARPIARDDRVHIEYVPTQVVTEYVRTTKLDGQPFDGIRYRSSRRDGGISLVLFADAENVVGASMQNFGRSTSDEWLELIDRSEQVVSNTAITTIDRMVAEAESVVRL